MSRVRSSLIGSSVPKLDAAKRVIGDARYMDDLTLPRMLHGKILRADRPSARILGIDTSRAEVMEGVRAVITAADIPNHSFGHGRDNTPLKGEVVRCIRDEIAAVAADTPEQAEAACRRIEVKYGDLPPILTTDAARASGARAIHGDHPENVALTYHYDHGEVEQGRRASAHVVESTFHLRYVTHCCLGVSGVVASFDGEGKLTIWSQTQVPFLYRRDLAAIVGLDPRDIRVIQPFIGGAFGSKLDIYPFEPICVHLAQVTRRPVKILFSREEEFVASPTRQPAEIRCSMGCDADGNLTFREADLVLDNGGYTSWGATTPFVMMQTFSSLYRVPHVRFDAEVVYTNNPYAGSFRGYGNLQASFTVESLIDELADRVGMDPLELRLQNAQEQGEVTGQGMVISSCGFRECLEGSTTAARWKEKREEYRQQTGRVRRGIGMASMLHVGGGAKIYRSDGCGSILKLDDFGAVTLITGASEIGQGSETALAMITAEELGVKLEVVRVVNDDSEIRPWDVGVHASRTTFIAGNSARLAARAAREKLLKAAARLVERPEQELTIEDGEVLEQATGKHVMSVPKVIRSLHFQDKSELVVTNAYYEPPSVAQDEKFKGNVSATYAWATQVAEVEVDMDTGIIRVLKISAAHDVGRVINRLGCEGQVEGGIAMGMGYTLSEELLVQEGRVRNPCFRDYKIMTAPDMPEIELILVESLDEEGPFGAKGLGEAPAICTAPAIVNAVKSATGRRFTGLPITPERVAREFMKDAQ